MKRTLRVLTLLVVGVGAGVLLEREAEAVASSSPTYCYDYNWMTVPCEAGAGAGYCYDADWYQVSCDFYSLPTSTPAYCYDSGWASISCSSGCGGTYCYDQNWSGIACPGEISGACWSAPVTTYCYKSNWESTSCSSGCGATYCYDQNWGAASCPWNVAGACWSAPVASYCYNASWQQLSCSSGCGGSYCYDQNWNGVACPSTVTNACQTLSYCYNAAGQTSCTSGCGAYACYDQNWGSMACPSSITNSCQTLTYCYSSMGQISCSSGCGAGACYDQNWGYMACPSSIQTACPVLTYCYNANGQQTSCSSGCGATACYSQNWGYLACPSSITGSCNTNAFSTTNFEVKLYPSGGYDKPIAVIEGIDFLDERKPDNYMTGAEPVLQALPSVAAQHGLDVFMVSVKQPMSTYSVDQIAWAYAQEVHPRIRTWTGVQQKYILAGFSGGGIVARGAANYLGSSRAADLAAYISFDAPHEGAYIPRGLQAYMADHAICGNDRTIEGDYLTCHARYIKGALGTQYARSLMRTYIYPTCGSRAGYQWPSAWTDCRDVGGCTLPNDMEWNHCGGDHGNFGWATNSDYMLSYLGWFNDIPRYAVSNADYATSATAQWSLTAYLFGWVTFTTYEVLKADVNTIKDHHIYIDNEPFARVLAGSDDPFLDKLDNKKFVNNNAPDATLRKKANFKFISKASAFGLNTGLTWTGRLTGQCGNKPHVAVTYDTINYIMNVVNGTFAGSGFAGDRNPTCSTTASPSTGGGYYSAPPAYSTPIPDSCYNTCGGWAGSCSCDLNCAAQGNCCADACSYCGACGNGEIEND